jgi:hypothetical protein
MQFLLLHGREPYLLIGELAQEFPSDVVPSPTFLDEVKGETFRLRTHKGFVQLFLFILFLFKFLEVSDLSDLGQIVCLTFDYLIRVVFLLIKIVVILLIA